MRIALERSFVTAMNNDCLPRQARDNSQEFIVWPLKRNGWRFLYFCFSQVVGELSDGIDTIAYKCKAVAMRAWHATLPDCTAPLEVRRLYA